MKVVVTGAGGFLGRHLVAGLLARGDRVVAVDLCIGRALPEGAETVTADVTDRAAMETACEGADAVIHGAAVTGLWARDASRFERINTGGTETVLAAAAASGVARAVHVSSFVTLISGGRAAPRRLVDETLELAPDAMLGPYPRSKRLAELAALAAPLPTVIVQPPAPIGPGDWRPTPPMGMLTDLANGAIPAMIDCDWALVDIPALAAGVLAALDRGRPGQRYLMVGEQTDTAGLLERFARVAGVPGPRARVPYGVALAAARAETALSGLTGKPPKAPLTGVRLAGPRITFDGSRAATELGFAPPPLEEALRRALLWLRENGRLTRALPGLDSP